MLLLAGVPAVAAEVPRAALRALVAARMAEESGQPDAALSALSALASAAPGLPGVDGRMLEQAVDAGDFVAARTAANRLWQRGDRRFDAQLVLIIDALRRSDWKGARTLVHGRSDKTGGDAMARLIAPVVDGWIDAGAGVRQPDRYLVGAEAGGPPQPALALEAALLQIADKRLGDARALAAKTQLSDRLSQLVALRVAATFDKAGEVEAAGELRRRIALAAGGREDPVLLLPQQPVSTPRGGVAHWFALLADSFARAPNGGGRAAMLFARSAAWLDGEDWSVRAALVETLDRAERGDAAIAFLAADRRPLPAVMRMRRAEIHADAGKMAEALAEAEAAVAAPDTARSLLIRLADVARRSDDRAAAERAYLRLEASLGDSEDDRLLRATLLIARADLHLQADDWQGAQPLIEQAVALRPTDPTILNFAGYSALERRHDVDASLARIEAAWRGEPQSPSITDSLGWAYLLTGRVADAVPLLEKAERGEPGNAVIVEHLGDAYWTAGQKFAARYNWRAAALLADGEMAERLAAKLRDGLSPATLAP